MAWNGFDCVGADGSGLWPIQPLNLCIALKANTSYQSAYLSPLAPPLMVISFLLTLQQGRLWWENGSEWSAKLHRVHCRLSRCMCVCDTLMYLIKYIDVLELLKHLWRIFFSDSCQMKFQSLSLSSTAVNFSLRPDKRSLLGVSAAGRQCLRALCALVYRFN